MALSHFDEKSGIVPCKTPWGKWWQTVSEVSIQVDLSDPVTKNEVKILIKPSFIECTIKGETIFKGELCRCVIADECTWVIEERKTIYILLTKVDPPEKEVIWESLLKGQYSPNPFEEIEIRKKLDLERFQLQNPGFDFSNAKLDKRYDNLSFDSSNNKSENTSNQKEWL